MFCTTCKLEKDLLSKLVIDKKELKTMHKDFNAHWACLMNKKYTYRQYIIMMQNLYNNFYKEIVE